MAETNLLERIQGLGLAEGQYAVLGAGLLEAWELRQAESVEVLVTDRLYQLLLGKGWEEHRDGDFLWLTHADHPGIEVSRGFDERELEGYEPETARLIREAMRIEGVAFVRPEEVILIKRASSGEQDQEGIKLIQEYLRRPK